MSTEDAVRCRWYCPATIMKAFDDLFGMSESLSEHNMPRRHSYVASSSRLANIPARLNIDNGHGMTIL